MNKIWLASLCLFVSSLGFAENKMLDEIKQVDSGNNEEAPVSEAINDHLHSLKVSNINYVKHISIEKKLAAKKKKAKKNSDKKPTEVVEAKPFAIIFSDITPDTSPEKIFMQKKETLYVIRSPGLVTNEEILAGINQTVKIKDIPIVIVMGQTPDPLMKQACEGFNENYSSVLIGKLQEAVRAARVDLPEASCNSEQMINAIAKHNMINSVSQIIKSSPEIGKRIKDAKLKVIGAIMDRKTKQVEFFDSVDI